MGSPTFRVRESDGDFIFERKLSTDNWYRVPADGRAVVEGLELTLGPGEVHIISAKEASPFILDALNLTIRDEVRLAVDRHELTHVAALARAEIQKLKRAAA